jgi:hypothetical protein
MNKLLQLILRNPEAFDETQVPCCLRGVWLSVLTSRQTS